uniref:DNA-binding protein inhibitor ID-4 n=1 Tax=Esox lucius TaxID=8010 RepID=A0AAY5KSP5_ESOLU
MLAPPPLLINVRNLFILNAVPDEVETTGPWDVDRIEFTFLKHFCNRFVLAVSWYYIGNTVFIVYPESLVVDTSGCFVSTRHTVRSFTKMKAVTPVRPQKDSSSGSSDISLHYLSQHSLNIGRCRMEEEDQLCLQYDMNHCYSRLKRLVPTIPQGKKVSKVEILQHVIDYILDLQLALETHPSLLKQQTGTGTGPSGSNRTPLTVLNTDHQPGSRRPHCSEKTCRQTTPEVGWWWVVPVVGCYRKTEFLSAPTQA